MTDNSQNSEQTTENTTANKSAETGGTKLSPPAVEAKAQESQALETTKNEEVKIPELSPEQIQAILKSHRFKVKIDGAEKEVDPDELVNNYQLREASHKKFQEAAKLREQIESVKQQLKSDPRKALAELELNPDDLAEKWLTEKIQKEIMSPEERKVAELEAKLQSVLKEKEEFEAKKRAEEEMQAEEKYFNDYQKSITSALEASPLANTPEAVRAVANLMSEAITAGYDLNATDAVKMLADQYKTGFKPMFQKAPVDYLFDMLGEDMVKALSMHLASKLKPVNPIGSTPKLEDQAPAKKREVSEKDKKYRNLEDAFEELRKKYQ